MQPPIGVSDFHKLIQFRDTKGNPYSFVDKTLFIKELLDNAIDVTLITRPRRFGKTLNMSMLHYFLAPEVDGITTQALFQNLNISRYKEYMDRYQGKYPVVYITFKDVGRESNFETAYNSFCKVISRIYAKYQYLLSSETLASHQKKIFESILEERATPSSIQSSLLDLTRLLYLHHGVKPWVLIDEYDTPIQTAYMGKYYKEMIILMRGFLSAGLKDNTSLEQAVLTGILRVSKESIFSGLNNLKTYSLLHPRYGEHFGFTEKEVTHLLSQSGLNQNLETIKEWYNGYQVGESIIYNPWSIVNYIKEQGKLNAYWVNISDNALVKELLFKSHTNLKIHFESLLQDKSIEIFIDEHITFDNFESNESAIWSLLLMSGYLKANVIEERSQGALCQLLIPNKEVKDLFRILIVRWLSGVDSPTVFNQFIDNLLLGNMEDFSTHLQTIMLQTVSVYDIKGKEPEKFFHGFMLGLIASIDLKKYIIDSNKESGLGRFDIIIIPKDPSKLGIIIEIKSNKNHDPKKLNDPKQLKALAEKALEQIDMQRYSTVFAQHQIKKLLKIGIVFSGKEFEVVHRIETKF